MFPYASAIVPIFLWEPKASRPRPVGSSVMLRIANKTCLLTAAHVADLRTEGKLCIPGLSGLTKFAGGIGFNLLPPDVSRYDDPLDIAFLMPEEDQQSALPDEYIPVKPRAVDATGPVNPGDFCLVAGFPGSRNWVKHRDGEITSSRLNFVGIACEYSKYATYGCNPNIDILIEYHIDKAIYPEGDKVTPPSAQGMSGGGVFRIGRDVQARPNSSVADLVGIMHQFKERKVFVATKIGEVLKLIAERIPNDVSRQIGA